MIRNYLLTKSFWIVVLLLTANFVGCSKKDVADERPEVRPPVVQDMHIKPAEKTETE